MYQYLCITSISIWSFYWWFHSVSWDLCAWYLINFF